MYWHCDICDDVFYEGFRNSHLQSRFHRRLAMSIIGSYFITNPKPNKVDDTIRKLLRSHYKTYEKFQVILSVKLLSPSDQIKNNRRQHSCHRDQHCTKNSFFSSKTKTIKKQLYSHILELGRTFVSHFEIIRFEYYLTKPKSLLEWMLLAMSNKNPENVHSFDYKRYNYPFFRDFFKYLPRCFLLK